MGEDIIQNGADLEQKCDERRPIKNLNLACLCSLVTAQMTTGNPALSD